MKHINHDYSQIKKTISKHSIFLIKVWKLQTQTITTKAFTNSMISIIKQILRMKLLSIYLLVGSFISYLLDFLDFRILLNTVDKLRKNLYLI